MTRREVQMTIEMAKVMSRIRSMRPRAKRLLNAVLPHAIALETIELEEDILAMIEIIDKDMESESGWKAFLHKVQKTAKVRLRSKKREEFEKIEEKIEGKKDKKDK